MDLERLELAAKRLEALLEKREVFKPSAATPPVFTNRYRVRGERSQSKRARVNRQLKVAPTREPDNERLIQPLFEQEPSLLFTPNLLSGGLLADSIFTQVPLPSWRKPDFVYLSTEANRIKITLVEIESSKRRIFLHGWKAGSKFYYRCEEGIDQVRQWKKDLGAAHKRTTLLSTFEGLLNDYPYPIFDQHGELSSAIELSIDYVLIIGEDQPTTPEHWSLIDKLYREEGIVLLSYPMLIDAAKKMPVMRNMLKLSCKKGLVVQTSHAPDSLPGSAISEETHAISVRALGKGSPFLMPGSTSFTNSQMARRILYRSEGKCEYPGCQHSLEDYGNGLFFSLLYRVITDDLRPQELVDWRRVGLFCENHAVSVAYDPKTQRMYRTDQQPHPLQEAFCKIGGYRVDLDIASSNLIDRHWDSVHRDKCQSLGLHPVFNESLFFETLAFLKRLSALPSAVRVSLARIATTNSVKRHQRAKVSALHADLLRRFGLVRIAEGKGGSVILADGVPFGLYDQLVRLHGDEQASRLLWDIYVGKIGIGISVNTNTASST